MGAFLRSPARPYIKAKGVESVPSPVANVSSVFPSSSSVSGSGSAVAAPFSIQRVIGSVVEEFIRLYGVGEDAFRRAQGIRVSKDEPGSLFAGDEWVVGTVGGLDGCAEWPEIRDGVDELKVSLRFILYLPSLTRLLF